MAVNVLVVYTHDFEAGQELSSLLPGAQLTAAAQNHQRILHHILLAWEKIKFKNSKYGFY